MKIVFTKHVLEKLAERRIGKELVESCVENPDFIFPEEEGKKAYLKDIGKNYLKTIVAEEEAELVVVTVYWFAKVRLKRYNPD